MCIGTPKVPTVPERQTTKLPDNGAADSRASLLARRRRGLYASILTSPRGALGTANVTGVAGATLG